MIIFIIYKLCVTGKMANIQTTQGRRPGFIQKEDLARGKCIVYSMYLTIIKLVILRKILKSKYRTDLYAPPCPLDKNLIIT